jgi:hypothetical protein
MRSIVPNFEGVKNFREMQKLFMQSAHEIMCRHDLWADNKCWEITAVELYLSTESEVWKDPYVHCAEEQACTCTWYVHGDGRRAPIYAGIDLTCGSKAPLIRGGILIRELSQEKRWVFQRLIRGENINVTRKENVWSTTERELIGQINHRSAISHGGYLRLLPCVERRVPLWVGPRIGLGKAHSKEANREGFAFRTSPLRAATWQTVNLRSQMMPYKKEPDTSNMVPWG